MSKKAGGAIVCKWTECSSQSVQFESQEDLSQHVDECHLEPCSHQDLFFCLWEGCKVYNKPSYSYSWLKRHTKEKHTKERPNKCLMNGCNKAFNSVDALQRHMMRHFQQTPPPQSKGVQSNSRMTDKTPPVSLSPCGALLEANEDGGSDVGSISSTNSPKAPNKARKRYSLKVKIARRAAFTSAQSTNGPVAFNGAHLHGEVLDRRTMAVIKQTANILAVADAHQSQPGTCVTMTAQIVGKRRRNVLSVQEDELLVRWKPRLFPDSWVPLSLFKEQKVVSLQDLSPGQLSSIADSCLGYHSYQHRKNKRKPDTQ